MTREVASSDFHSHSKQLRSRRRTALGEEEWECCVWGWTDYGPRFVQIRVSHTVFIAAQVITAKRWEQLKCPSLGRWINKMWCRHPVEYNAGIKRTKGWAWWLPLVIPAL